MYHVYCGIHRITDNPVSYNYLLKVLNTANVPWKTISSMPLDGEVVVGEFKIVRKI